MLRQALFRRPRDAKRQPVIDLLAPESTEGSVASGAGLPSITDGGSKVFDRLISGTGVVGAAARPEASANRSFNELIGELSTLVVDPEVTDILLNPDGTWIEKSGRLVVAKKWHFDEAERYQLARYLTAHAETRLDLAAPIADAQVEVRGQKLRLNAIIPPLSSGTTISLRRPAQTPWSLATLKSKGMLQEAQVQRLQELIRSRENLIISGGTGSGKTTLLSALIAACPAQQRLICIEEQAELLQNHPHQVRLFQRAKNIQGAGEVSLRDLLKAALRMRPDRIILGESRGPEIVDVLAAMNTGHLGSITTLHANQASEVPQRLVSLGMQAGMAAECIKAQADSAKCTVIQLERTAEGGRRVADIRDWGELS
ncbi:hypothetical protein BSR29_00660 [Boudabousia liubingyangii]|uniref:Bacterial type II secretion system protein E domain-containing protein n=1 Tax=Boudabousia liubingyangii TaxID=1921764 RepID=A0A1Q5PPR0_9ACTO|nr:ATPase, T2SS/T4P/T4SS family [Boudabousia liubingyangii]OKL49506.1 hypothetical protein BSR29_00660 [Boudabousia liubingyangii]